MPLNYDIVVNNFSDLPILVGEILEIGKQYSRGHLLICRTVCKKKGKKSMTDNRRYFLDACYENRQSTRLRQPFIIPSLRF